MKTNNILLPNDYQRIKSLPTDPEGSATYGAQTSMSINIVQVYPITEEKAMAFDNDQQIIDGIHHCMADNQGIIEVKHGETRHGCSFVYSIVKTKQEASGMTYTLTFHLKKAEQTLCVHGFFGEHGTTGIRENAVLNACLENNEVQVDTGKGLVGWMRDPYDANYDKGIPMNLSEREIYDEFFPEHCLSQLRLFVSKILEIN